MDAKFDVVAAFSFGLPISSSVNRKINERAESIGEKLGVPVIKETDFALELGWNDRMDVKKWVSSTLKFSKHLASKKFSKILVVAATDHIQRCVRDLKKVGVEAESAESDEHSKNTDAFYYINSSQPFVKYRWRFLIREYILMNLPWKIYEKIAS